MRRLVCILVLMGCSGKEANHLGNPLTWPVQAVTTGLENATYNKRRGAVKSYVGQNLTGLKEDVATGGGPIFNQACDLAKVPSKDRLKLLKELQGNTALYFPDKGDLEPLVVAIMVHGP